MERINHFSRYWLRFYVAAWIIHALELVFGLTLNMPPADQHLSYAFIWTVSRLALLFVALAAVSSVVLYVIGTRDYFRAVLLFLATFVLMIFAFALLPHTSYGLSIIDSQFFYGHQYNLAAYTVNNPAASADKRFTESKVFTLFQCDSLNVVCTSIFSRAYESHDGFFPLDKDSFLTTEGGVMSLHVDGEVVYTSEQPS